MNEATTSFSLLTKILHLNGMIEAFFPPVYHEEMLNKAVVRTKRFFFTQLCTLAVIQLVEKDAEICQKLQVIVYQPLHSMSASFISATSDWHVFEMQQQLCS